MYFAYFDERRTAYYRFRTDYKNLYESHREKKHINTVLKRLFYQGLLIRTAIVVKGRGGILLTSISEVQLQTGAKF